MPKDVDFDFGILYIKTYSFSAMISRLSSLLLLLLYSYAFGKTSYKIIPGFRIRPKVNHSGTEQKSYINIIRNVECLILCDSASCSAAVHFPAQRRCELTLIGRILLESDPECTAWIQGTQFVYILFSFQFKFGRLINLIVSR